jgi:hypothetical protein
MLSLRDPGEGVEEEDETGDGEGERESVTVTSLAGEHAVSIASVGAFAAANPRDGS